MNKNKRYICVFLCAFLCCICILVFMLFLKLKDISNMEKSIDEYLSKAKFSYGEYTNIYRDEIDSVNTEFKEFKKSFNLYKINTNKKEIYLDKENAGILLNKENMEKKYIDSFKYLEDIEIYNPFKELGFFKRLKIKRITGKRYEAEIKKILPMLDSANIYVGDNELLDSSRFEILKYKNTYCVKFKKSLPVCILKDKDLITKTKVNSSGENFIKIDEKLKKENNIIYVYKYDEIDENKFKLEVPY